MPNLDLSEKIGKAVTSKANFKLKILQLSCSNFGLKQCERP